MRNIHVAAKCDMMARNAVILPCCNDHPEKDLTHPWARGCPPRRHVRQQLVCRMLEFARSYPPQVSCQKIFADGGGTWESFSDCVKGPPAPRKDTTLLSTSVALSLSMLTLLIDSQFPISFQSAIDKSPLQPPPLATCITHEYSRKYLNAKLVHTSLVLGSDGLFGDYCSKKNQKTIKGTPCRFSYAVFLSVKVSRTFRN